MKIEIKPITRQINNVNINLDILPQFSKVGVHVKYDGITEADFIMIEGAEYDAWGSDDSYIYNLVLSKLGLERA